MQLALHLLERARSAMVVREVLEAKRVALCVEQLTSNS